MCGLFTKKNLGNTYDEAVETVGLEGQNLKKGRQILRSHKRLGVTQSSNKSGNNLVT